MRALLLCLALGCSPPLLAPPGPDAGTEDAGAPELNPELAGTWGGVGTISFMGMREPYEAALDVTAEESLVTASGVCLEGAGAVTMTGSGTRAEWIGSHTCPAMSLGFGCYVVVTWKNGALWLTDEGRLRANLEGTMEWCGTPHAASVDFDLAK